jgi:xanthine dehydrogenase accessory factor
VKEVVPDIERWRARGERFALATVVATRRSAPRPIGSKLAVSESGELAGSVSGGCVENEVYGAAREVLAGAPPQLLSYGISDDQALSVGLPCGGEIDVYVQVPEPEVVERVLGALATEERAVVLTELETGEQRLVRDPELERGRSRLVELDGRRVFADVYGPPPRLLIFGAVDTAEALCRAAKAVGWRTIVADARAKFATRERLPSADELVVAWPDEVLARVEPDHATAVVVLTHNDRFDLPALQGALAGEAFYVGALGSRRNQARRRERLLEEGVPEESVDRISGPAGLDIGADTPAETALSILAEILAVRAGRGGGALKEAPGRIHTELVG